ncbi:MAG TPA: FAD:protein FMN transferase [Mycobacteriales bacterium]|jgi:thiamine biosynthesis lipoprotein|nr:FAD:protein FMN transferase [Mycobacteriales bacterium]
MGTVFSFDVRGQFDATAFAGVLERLHEWDAVFSTYRIDSAVSRLNRGEVSVDDCPADVARVLALCGQAAERTDGWFSAWAGGVLDPSGIVKGWAVQQASELLRAAGGSAHIVNGGGDIQSAGGPWRFGITDPQDSRRLLTVVGGVDLAVATSGSAERGNHILNPFTRRPATDLLSVTVVGPSLTDADVYATAAFAMGDAARDWLKTLEGYGALVVGRDGAMWRTPDLPEVSSR